MCLTCSSFNFLVCWSLCCPLSLSVPPHVHMPISWLFPVRFRYSFLNHYPLFDLQITSTWFQCFCLIALPVSWISGLMNCDEVFKCLNSMSLRYLLCWYRLEESRRKKNNSYKSRVSSKLRSIQSSFLDLSFLVHIHSWPFITCWSTDQC